MPEMLTIGDRLYWAYANLGMAHAAIESQAAKYGRNHFIVRSKLYTGLRKGSLQPGPLADDDRLKMILPQACCYCGSGELLAADHLIPRKRGGPHTGENLVWACRSCNSSKGAIDAMEWLARQNRFPPLLLLRRYLKLAIQFSREKEILHLLLQDAPVLPFVISAIPEWWPPPTELQLWVRPLIVTDCSRSGHMSGTRADSTQVENFESNTEVFEEEG
jgi:hypothetical protein